MDKPRIRKDVCRWIVLTPHPVYGWAYNRVHKTWEEALQYALKMAKSPAIDVKGAAYLSRK